MRIKQDPQVKAYQEGEQAWLERYVREPQCPYATRGGQSLQRTAWWNGYYDARISETLGPVLQSVGATWP